MKFEDMVVDQPVTALCTRCASVHDWTVRRKIESGERVILDCVGDRQPCGLNMQFVRVKEKYGPEPKPAEPVVLLEGDHVKAKCAECSTEHAWTLEGPNMGLRVLMSRAVDTECDNARQLVRMSAITEHKGDALV